MALSPKQQRFIAEYLIDLNASQAAIRAGYSKKNPNVVGPRLLAQVGIAEAIAAAQAKHLEKAELNATRVLEEYRRLAFADLRSFFDADGNLKRVQDLSADQGSVLASFEVVKKNAEAGDGKIDTIHKFKIWDKTRALESLAKHFGLLTEKVEHSGGLDIVWKDSE